jgi:hypothetical protein
LCLLRQPSADREQGLAVAIGQLVKDLAPGGIGQGRVPPSGVTVRV